MDRAYLVSDDGSTTEFQSVQCKNEDKEIQNLLEKNFNLLPGEQIAPEAPCRWLLIRREMPVPDPYSGSDRWSIDFFFVDQEATPTFVECKRFADTRSRREVVGQMLEYAANGQYYWSAEQIRKHAEQSAAERKTTLDLSFQALGSDGAASLDQFFEEVNRRLKAGEIRLIFFLEQAPDELKRLVEFMNKQMSLSEVLLVEARLYAKPDIKIVIPRLFGFNEQARAIRRTVIAEATREAVASDWEGFVANARAKKLDEANIAQCKLLYEGCKQLMADIAWGRGTVTASFTPKWKFLESKIGPFSVYANGAFELHLSSYQAMEGTPAVFRDCFAQGLSKALPLREDYATDWHQYPRSVWMTRSNEIVAALRAAVQQATSAATALGA